MQLKNFYDKFFMIYAKIVNYILQNLVKFTSKNIVTVCKSCF